MKSFIISDNEDTYVGLMISGIKGTIVKTPEEAHKVLDTIKDNNEIKILIFTEKAALMIQDKIDEMKLSKHGPLIVEIPDRNGTIRGNDSILGYIKEAIGLKI